MSLKSFSLICIISLCVLFPLAATYCKLVCWFQINVLKNETARFAEKVSFRCHWNGTIDQTPRKNCTKLTRKIMAEAKTRYYYCNILKDCFRRGEATEHRSINLGRLGIRIVETDFLADFPSLQKAILSHNDIVEAGPGAFRNSNFSKVNLKLNGLRRLSTHFANMSNLKSLDLSLNQIVSINYKVFQGTTNLRCLYLRGNKLKTLSFLSVFSRLESLELEYADDFSLDEFPNFTTLTDIRLTFHKNVNLTRLPLYHEQLRKLTVDGVSAISDTFFENMPKLKAVRIANGNFLGLKPRLLRNMSNMTRFNMFNLGIENIEKDTFHGARSLSVLRLRGNSIFRVNYTNFQKLKTLKYLDLSQNNIRWIEKKSFSSLENLKVLNLSFNQLDKLDEYVFAELTELQFISLESNRLASIALPAMGSLSKLILDNNSFTEIDSALMANLTGLTQFSILHNPLEKIPEKSFHHSDIVDIRFGCCSYRLLEDNAKEVKKYCHDTNMTIEKNALQLRNYHHKTRNLLRLSILGCAQRLSDEKLQIMVDRLEVRWNHLGDTLGNLQIKNSGENAEFFLQNNEIESLKYKQFPSINAKQIDLSDNRINVIDVNAFKNSEIAVIRLNGNRIHTLKLYFDLRLSGPDRFQYIEAINSSIKRFHVINDKRRSKFVKSFISVDLSYNQIYTLSNVKLKGFRLIRSLNLSHNNIKHFKSTVPILQFYDLENLDLSYNRLKFLPSEVTRKKHMKIIATGNEWDCSKCEAVFLFGYAVRYMSVTNLECSHNRTLAKEWRKCNFTDYCVPYFLLSSIALLVFLKGLHSLNILRLKQKYGSYHSVPLLSLVKRGHFVRISKLHQSILHNNVLLLHAFATEFSAKNCLQGYSFVQRTYCSLLEALEPGNPTQLILDRDNLCWQLLKGLEHLHSFSIFHSNLRAKSIYLTGGLQKWTVKIGNFKKARTIAKFSDDFKDALDEDLNAAAALIDFIQKPRRSIEFRVLSLALENGLTADEALRSPAFVPIPEKILFLNEVSETLKNKRKMNGDTSFAEKHASLVIGGRGAWNRLFEDPGDIHLLAGFAGQSNKYRITQVADLIRFVRNVNAHANDEPMIMEKVFENSAPDPETLYRYFANKFPYLYLHAVTISPNAPKVYMKEYANFAQRMECEGIANEVIVPLATQAEIRFEFKYFVFDGNTHYLTTTYKTLTLPGEPMSAIDWPVLAKEIKPDVERRWPGVPMACILCRTEQGVKEFGYCDQTQLEPLASANFSTRSESPVLEGSVIEISRMQYHVVCKEFGLDRLVDFKIKDNVKAIRGNLIKHTTRDAIKSTRVEAVFLNGRQVRDKENISQLPFSNFPFVVTVSSIGERDVEGKREVERKSDGVDFLFNVT